MNSAHQQQNYHYQLNKYYLTFMIITGINPNIHHNNDNFGNPSDQTNQLTSSCRRHFEFGMLMSLTQITEQQPINMLELYIGHCIYLGQLRLRGTNGILQIVIYSTKNSIYG